MEIKCYKVCRIRCRKCGDVIEHINHTKTDNYHRLKYCSCGAIGLDPSAMMYRVLATPPATLNDYEDLSEEWPEDEIDEKINAIGKAIIEKHIEAFKKLAEGEE